METMSTIGGADNGTDAKIEIIINDAPKKHFITKDIYWIESKNEVENYRNELYAWYELLPTKEKSICINLPIKQQLSYAKHWVENNKPKQSDE